MSGSGYMISVDQWNGRGPGPHLRICKSKLTLTKGENRRGRVKEVGGNLLYYRITSMKRRSQRSSISISGVDRTRMGRDAGVEGEHGSLS